MAEKNGGGGDHSHLGPLVVGIASYRIAVQPHCALLACIVVLIDAVLLG